jgi:hypothetical protein
MYRGTVYFERTGATDDAPPHITRNVLEHDVEDEAGFRAKVVEVFKNAGVALGFGPIGRPWRRMRPGRFATALLLLLLAPASAWAQSKCAASGTAFQKNPGQAAIPNVNATLPDGSPMVGSVRVSYRTQAAPGTEVANAVIQRTAFTQEAGFPTCFLANITRPMALVDGTAYVSVARFTSPSGVDGPDSPASNPFFWDGAPPAPASIRLVARLLDSFVNRLETFNRWFFDDWRR